VLVIAAHRLPLRAPEAHDGPRDFRVDDDIILAAGVSEEMKLLALWVDFVEDGQQVELEVVGSAGFSNCGSVVRGVVGHGFYVVW